MKLPALLPSWRPSQESALSLAEIAHKAARATLFLCALAGFLAGVYLLGARMDHFVRKSPYFVIDNVEVLGASTSLEKQIRAELTERVRDQGNLLLFNASHAQFWIEALPRVSHATLDKRYPRTLRVSVDERKPVAGAAAGDLYWMDGEGVLLAKASAAELTSARAPMITGLPPGRLAPGMRLSQPRLAEALQTIRFLGERDPELARQFVEWHLSQSGEIVGILAQGVEVRFGESDPIARLPTLAAALRKVDNLEGRTYVDLRFDHQVVYY